MQQCTATQQRSSEHGPGPDDKTRRGDLRREPPRTADAQPATPNVSRAVVPELTTGAGLLAGVARRSVCHGGWRRVGRSQRGRGGHTERVSRPPFLPRSMPSFGTLPLCGHLARLLPMPCHPIMLRAWLRREISRRGRDGRGTCCNLRAVNSCEARRAEPRRSEAMALSHSIASGRVSCVTSIQGPPRPRQSRAGWTGLGCSAWAHPYSTCMRITTSCHAASPSPLPPWTALGLDPARRDPIRGPRRRRPPVALGG